MRGNLISSLPELFVQVSSKGIFYMHQISHKKDGTYIYYTSSGVQVVCSINKHYTHAELSPLLIYFSWLSIFPFCWLCVWLQLSTCVRLVDSESAEFVLTAAEPELGVSSSESSSLLLECGVPQLSSSLPLGRLHSFPWACKRKKVPARKQWNF